MIKEFYTKQPLRINEVEVLRQALSKEYDCDLQCGVKAVKDWTIIRFGDC